MDPKMMYKSFNNTPNPLPLSPQEEIPKENATAADQCHGCHNDQSMQFIEDNIMKEYGSKKEEKDEQQP